MEDKAENIFNSFYTRLVLRDFLGKIVPGSVILLAISFTFNLFVYTQLLSEFWLWLLFIGFAWIAGFIAQGFGHWIHIINYEPRKGTDEEYIKQLLKFGYKATTLERQQLERYLIIREATGNFSVSLILCTFMLILSTIFNKLYDGFPYLQ